MDDYSKKLGEMFGGMRNNAYLCSGTYKERTNMNTSISIDTSLFNFAVKCAKVEKVDVNQLIESILWDGLDQLQSPLSDTDDELSEMEALPKSVLISAAEYALSESNKERGISNDNVESVISKRRGWR